MLPRAVVTIAVLPEVDDTSIAISHHLENILLPEAISLHRARSISRYHDIGVLDQFLQGFAILCRILQIERAVPFAPFERSPLATKLQQTVGSDHLTIQILMQPTHIRNRPSDPHNTRAHLSQTPRNRRRSNDAGHVNDLETSQRPLSGGLHRRLFRPPRCWLGVRIRFVEVVECNMGVRFPVFAFPEFIATPCDRAGLFVFLVHEFVEVG